MRTLHCIPISVLLLAASGAASGSFANTTDDTAAPPQRGPGHPGPRLDPERRLARLTAELGLTAEQQARIRRIFASETETMKQFEATSPNRQERRAKFRELRRDHRQKIAAVLTPAQRAKFAAVRPEAARRQPGDPAGAPHPSPDAAE